MPATHNDVAASKKQKTERKVKQKKLKIADPAVNSFKTMKKAVRSALTDCEPGNELETLIHTLQHNVQVQQVRDDILAAFQSYYPGEFEEGQIHLFGSAVMGLAFNDSDLDFYIELPSCEKSKSKKDRIIKVRNILEPTKKFANFESITNPRVPIVKCTHIGTLINCDFNSSNKLGTLNSPIVAHLLQFDHRIHKLAVVIKYWTKIHDCAGINRISNYAVVWMLIFYLQTLPEPIVPPIEEFQRNIPPSMTSHYNYAFDYSMPNRTENQSQWPELLLGFFEFYRDFDYASQLICPLYGKTFSKTDVQQKKLIEFRRYEEILLTEMENPMRLAKSVLCIQDPFEIIRKIPGDISIKNFQRIVSKIGCAAEIIESELQKGETKSLLLQIFDIAKFDEYANKDVNTTKSRRRRDRKTERKDNKAERKETKAEGEKTEAEQQKIETEQKECFPISVTSVLSKNEQKTKVIVQLKPTNFVLAKIQLNILKTDDQIDDRSIRKLWAKGVVEMIPDVLRDIFYLDLYDDDDDDDYDDDAPSDEFTKKIDLIGARNLFVGRKQKSVAKTWNQEVLDSSNRFKRTSSSIPLDVSAKITADTKNFDSVSIEFTDEIKTKTNNFYRAFYSYFIDTIDYFLKIYFVHRNRKAKPATVNGSSAEMKSATESTSMLPNSPTVKSTSTLPNTPTVSENAQNPKNTFVLKPTKLMLSTTRDMLAKSINDVDKAAVQQFWAETVIEFIVEILENIFALKLFDLTPDRFQKTFDASGACDVFTDRKQRKPIDGNTLNLELQESTNRFVCLTTPMTLSVRVATDVKRFDSVAVEFSDRIKTENDNFVKTFYRQFNDNIGYLLEVCFVHRHKMILKSNTLQCKFVKYEPEPTDSQ